MTDTGGALGATTPAVNLEKSEIHMLQKETQTNTSSQEPSISKGGIEIAEEESEPVF